MLADLGRHAEAMSCYEQALAIDPRDAKTWYTKAQSEEALGLRREAALSYRKFLEFAGPQDEQLVTEARERLVELESHWV